MSPTTPTIVLVRHGPTTHRVRGWMNAATLRQWLSDYEQSRLQEGAVHPPNLRELAQAAGSIIASDAPRALMSARAIADDRPVTTSALLREIPMFIPELGGARLPLLGWALVLSGHARFTGRWTTQDAAVADRVNDAAEYLVNAAEKNLRIVAVVHANIRVELARRLAHHRWECNERSHRYAHWSAWHFRPGTNFPAWQRKLRSAIT